MIGFEPTTNCLEGSHSTTELHPHCESGRFRILLLYPLSGCLTFGFTLNTLPSHQKSIRHNTYYVKSRRQGSNLRPEIYKIPALSLSYSGKAPHLGNAPSYLELTVRPIRLLGRGEYGISLPHWHEF